MGLKLLKKLKKDTVYIKAGIVAAVSVICFTGVFLWDNAKEIETNDSGQKILQRNRHGQGDSSAQVRAAVGEREEEISVTVSEQAYTEEELDAVFRKASERLGELILGENESLDEVRADLSLIQEIPDTGISVSWELDRYDVMDLQGTLIPEKIPEDGTLVKLSASLLYEEQKAVYEFYARIYPPVMSSSEQVRKELEEELIESDESTRTEEYLVLPDQVGGELVDWDYAEDTRAFGILILGAGCAAMICVSEKQSAKEDEKRRIRQMKLDYPQIINKFNLYISAGMTIRRAWFCIAGDYEKKRKNFAGDYEKKRKNFGTRAAYEEMVYTMHEIQGGAPEGECYEKYGIRCGISRYRKFGTMLSQNLRKGSRGITELLSREAEEAFEDRKNLAKKLGEEAGTKMMIPMFIMLAVVFIIVTVPAFFSIRI